jgi:2'-hydroxyisoflavone reductase
MPTRRDLLRLAPTLAASALAPRLLAAEPPRPAAPRRILMLGGTGFLGPDTVEAALARGHEVTLFNRGKTQPGLFPDLEKLRGDRQVDDYASLKGRSFDAVVDTSANVPRWVRQAIAALGPDHIGHYVYVSSVSVYPDMSKPGTDETAPVATIDDPNVEQITGETYGALKALSEKAAQDALPDRVAVVRPGLIVGPGDPTDRFTYWPARVARGGEVLAPGTPDDPIQIIDARDLGAWIVKLMEDGTRGTFNALSSPDTLTIGATLEACKHAAASDAAFTFVPAAFLAEQGVQPWSDMPAWVPHEGETAGFMHVSNTKAVDAGLSFRPVLDTARDTLAWFRTLPEARQAKLRAGIDPEREKAVLAAWKKAQG